MPQAQATRQPGTCIKPAHVLGRIVQAATLIRILVVSVRHVLLEGTDEQVGYGLISQQELHVLFAALATSPLRNMVSAGVISEVQDARDAVTKLQQGQ